MTLTNSEYDTVKALFDEIHDQHLPVEIEIEDDWVFFSFTVNGEEYTLFMNLKWGSLGLYDVANHRTLLEHD